MVTDCPGTDWQDQCPHCHHCWLIQRDSTTGGPFPLNIWSCHFVSAFVLWQGVTISWNVVSYVFSYCLLIGGQDLIPILLLSEVFCNWKPIATIYTKNTIFDNTIHLCVYISICDWVVTIFYLPNPRTLFDLRHISFELENAHIYENIQLYMYMYAYVISAVLLIWSHCSVPSVQRPAGMFLRVKDFRALGSISIYPVTEHMLEGESRWFNHWTALWGFATCLCVVCFFFSPKPSSVL